MEDVYRFVSDQKHLLIGGAVIGAVGLLGCTYYRNKSLINVLMKGRADSSKFTRRDCVYIIIPPRIGAIPSISPFCVKLETWLRMADIPHEVVESLFPSPSKKTFPYMYLNGEEMADSKFIIEKLSDYFGKNLNQHLTEMESALFVAYSRLLEAHILITYAWHRYTVGADQFWGNFKMEKLGPLGVALASTKEWTRKSIIEKATATGIGRHSPEEIYQIAEEDLKSLSIYLGDREFFFGRQPSVGIPMLDLESSPYFCAVDRDQWNEARTTTLVEIDKMDCILFAHLIQMVYIKTDFPPGKKIFSDYKNLLQFVERMKSRYYPDWDQLC